MQALADRRDQMPRPHGYDATPLSRALVPRLFADLALLTGHRNDLVTDQVWLVNPLLCTLTTIERALATPTTTAR